MQNFIKFPIINFNRKYNYNSNFNLNNYNKNKQDLIKSNNKTNSSNIFKITFDNYGQDKQNLIEINRTIKRIIIYLMIILLIKIYIYLEHSFYFSYY